jgi:hypothetical protein
MKELLININNYHKLYTKYPKPHYQHYIHILGKCNIIYNQLLAQSDNEGLQKLFKLLYNMFNVHLTCPKH